MRERSTACFIALLAMVALLALSLLGLPLPGAVVDSACASPASGWEDQTPFPGGERLYDIDAVNADTAWTVGEGGTVLMTTDGGENWELQKSSEENEYLRDVCAVDPSVAWAVGNTGADAVVYSTSDGGGTWVSHDVVTADFRQVPGGEYINTVQAEGVTAIDDQTAWVTANYYASVPNPFYPPFYIQSVFASSIWKTADGGANWTLQYFSLQPETLFKIYALDELTVWTAGGNTTSSYPLVAVSASLRSFDGGATWVTQDPQASWAVTYFSVADSSVAWGSPYVKTTDGGATWSSVDPDLYYSMRGVAAVDGDTAWVLGLVPVVQGKEGLIAKTVDGGQNYVTQYSGDDYLYGICALDASTAWVVGESGIILKTTGGGWQAPHITGIQPGAASEGTNVTLSGYMFGATQDSSYVSFGGVQATAYTSWSDTEIVAEVPAGVAGEVEVTVTTSEGTSNPVVFSAYGPLSVTSITPDTAVQNAITVQITDLAGNGFQPGATVRFEQGDTVLNAYDVNVVSGESITCKIGFFLTPAGAYDVVVKNPDGAEARLSGGFTVTSNCGQGGGTALLMLGLTLGLLSTAGVLERRRKRRRDS